MKNTKKALAILLTLIMILSLGSMSAIAASYGAQGTGGNKLTMLAPSDITDNTTDTDTYFKNTINTALDPAKDITFTFTMSSGMNNFSEDLFTTTNLPQITVCDSYGGTVVANPSFLIGGSSGISISIAAGTLTDGTYTLVFGKDIQGNNSSKTLGMDIAFEFTAETGAPPAESPFTDVPTWAKDYVAAVVMNGCMKGQTATAFGPDAVLTRGEFVTILGMARGIKTTNYAESAFADVLSSDTCSPYAAWAASKEIVNGTGDGMFSPDAPLTREQVVTMLYRYAQAFSMSTEATGSAAAFTDGGQVSTWADTAMSWAIGNSYIAGLGNGLLAPGASCTRVQVAKLIAVIIMAD